MGYTIKQKIDICLKAESNPEMTQSDLALWAKEKYGSDKPPSQTTISRILSSKNELVASKDADFTLVRRRRQQNPLLRKILGEWITQAIWENIPITTPIIQLTASAIWKRLPMEQKDGNGIFTQKWCSHFVKRLNVCLTGTEQDIAENPGNYKLNKIWKLDEKVELKEYISNLIHKENYKPQDIFTIDEFQLFYQLPLDQIFDISSIDKGLKQLSSSPENLLTIMLGCNINGTEKLTPLIVGKYERFDLSQSSHTSLKNLPIQSINQQVLLNRLTEIYQIFYKSNGNKWITLSMFQNYLLTLDHKLGNQSPPRKILIILDDSSSHRIINVKFNNIRLCYLKNNISQKNPYNTLYSGVKFDYLPMSFGIVDEFKILYRLQQYLEMINLQRIKSKKKAEEGSGNGNVNGTPGTSTNNGGTATNPPNESNKDASSTSTSEILSEDDYKISLVKVIEWIKRSWDSITQEKIYASWKKTHLINFNLPWPSNDLDIQQDGNRLLASMTERLQTYNHTKSYDKLLEIMGYLNTVIPFEIDDLLGLVNEKAKVTLSYLSIEEIIGSCLLEEPELMEDKDDTFTIPARRYSNNTTTNNNTVNIHNNDSSINQGISSNNNTNANVNDDLNENILVQESWFNLSSVTNNIDAPTPSLLNTESPLPQQQTPLPSIIPNGNDTPQLTNSSINGPMMYGGGTTSIKKEPGGLSTSPLPLPLRLSQMNSNEANKSASNSLQFLQLDVSNYNDYGATTGQSEQPTSSTSTPAAAAAALTINSLITAGNVLANESNTTSNLPLPNALSSMSKELADTPPSPLPPIINAKHRLDNNNNEPWQPDKRKPPMLFSGIPNANYGNFNYLSSNSPGSTSNVPPGFSQRLGYTDYDVIVALRKVLEIISSSPNHLKLSNGTIEELKSKLKEFQLKCAPRQYSLN